MVLVNGYSHKLIGTSFLYSNRTHLNNHFYNPYFFPTQTYNTPIITTPFPPKQS